MKSIWPSDNEAETSSASEQLLPLHYFIRETLRRSRANAEVLQLALYYLHKGRAAIRKRVSHMMETRSRFQELSAEKERQQHATAYPSPPSSPLDSRYNHAAAEFLKSSRDPVVCGRRMFLAALIIASKFIQDRTYSNRGETFFSLFTSSQRALKESSVEQLGPVLVDSPFRT